MCYAIQIGEKSGASTYLRAVLLTCGVLLMTLILTLFGNHARMYGGIVCAIDGQR